MKPSDITEWFFDALPFERKSSVDWILPSAIGLGLGLAAGVGVGMLLAPRPGAETRERLRSGAEELAGNLKEKAMDLADRAKGQISTATQQLGNGLATHGYSSEMHR